MQRTRNDSPASWRPRDLNDSASAAKNEVVDPLDQGYGAIGSEFARDIVIKTEQSSSDTGDRGSSWTNAPWRR